MSDFEAMGATVQKMRRKGWSVAITSNDGRRGYTANFTKLVEVGSRYRFQQRIGGEDEGLTMPAAVAKAAKNALAYEKETLGHAGDVR